MVIAVILTSIISTAASTPFTVLAAIGDQATKYVAISPIRILDTRENSAGALRSTDSLSAAPLTPAVLAAAGVSAEDVEAVAINLTITEPIQAGWLKTWPGGRQLPGVSSTSSVNNQFANENIANFAIVPLGAGRRISVQALRTSHVIIDVQGLFVRSNSSTDGRFIPLGTPKRALDTRGSRPVQSKTEIVVDLSSTAGIPRNASAAVINVVAADTQAAGFLTMWPDGSVRPDPASNINYPGGNYNIAGNAITRLRNGRIRIYAHGTTDVVVDVVGYFTGTSDSADTEGLFVPLPPVRHYDSRAGEPPTGTAPLGAGQGRRVTIGGNHGIPANAASAVAANITMTETAGPGFLAVYPKEPRPNPYSTVNAVHQQHSIANHAIVALNNNSLHVYSHQQSDFIVDVTGYFLAAGARVPTGPATPLADPAPTSTFNPARPPRPAPNQNYAYLFAQRAGMPPAPYSRGGTGYYGWDPCKPITFAVNASRATQSQIAALHLAVSQVETATGFDFIYVGEATGSMNTNSVDPRTTTGVTAMAVIGFSDPYETPALSGNTFGIGGVGMGIDNQPQLIQSSIGQPAYIVRKGFAFADITDVARDNNPALETRLIVSVLTHEIAHIIGLSHVDDSSQLMYGNLTSRQQFNTGDLNGLYNLGEPQCPSGAPLLDSSGDLGDEVGYPLVQWRAD